MEAAGRTVRRGEGKKSEADDKEGGEEREDHRQGLGMTSRTEQ